MSRIADNADDPQKVRALTATEKDTIKKRQKLIKLADKNKDGWLVVEEYESDDLASDTDDEKRIKKAKSAAEKRRKENPRGNDAKKFKTSDNQLFRGEYNVLMMPILFSVVSQLGWCTEHYPCSVIRCLCVKICRI